ncbi:MAG TPA: hypothetical protein VH062_02020 [Polyangiaceae bacterium]|jgi:hypothetical protein|nr:hypothetical protein [Polyangiaceae bacterium]
MTITLTIPALLITLVQLVGLVLLIALAFVGAVFLWAFRKGFWR